MLGLFRYILLILIIFTISNIYVFSQPIKEKMKDGSLGYHINKRTFSYLDYKLYNEDILTYLELSEKEASNITELKITEYDDADSLPISGKVFPNLKYLIIFSRGYRIYDLKGLSTLTNLDSLGLYTGSNYKCNTNEKELELYVNISEIWKLKNLKYLRIDAPIYELSDSILLLKNLKILYLDIEMFPFEVISKMDWLDKFWFEYNKYNNSNLLYFCIYLNQRYGYPEIDIRKTNKFNQFNESNKFDWWFPSYYDVLKTVKNLRFENDKNMYTVYRNNEIVGQGKIINGKRDGEWFFEEIDQISEKEKNIGYDIFDKGKLIERGYIYDDTIEKNGNKEYIIDTVKYKYSKCINPHIVSKTVEYKKTTDSKNINDIALVRETFSSNVFIPFYDKTNSKFYQKMIWNENNSNNKSEPKEGVNYKYIDLISNNFYTINCENDSIINVNLNGYDLDFFITKRGEYIERDNFSKKYLKYLDSQIEILKEFQANKVSHLKKYQEILNQHDK